MSENKPGLIEEPIASIPDSIITVKGTAGLVKVELWYKSDYRMRTTGHIDSEIRLKPNSLSDDSTDIFAQDEASYNNLFGAARKIGRSTLERGRLKQHIDELNHKIKKHSEDISV